MGNRVTLSFSAGFLCVGFDFRLSIEYMHHPMTPMKMSAGRSIIMSVLLRLRLTFLDTNFAPGYQVC